MGIELLLLLFLLGARKPEKPAVPLKPGGEVDKADGARDVELPGGGTYEFVYQFAKGTFSDDAAGKKRADAIAADLKQLDGFETFTAHRESGLGTLVRTTTRGLRFRVGSTAKLGGLAAALQRIKRVK